MPCFFPETLNFCIRTRIDLIESASCRVDYAGDLADDPRHGVIYVGLLEHCYCLPQTRFMHRVNRSA
jgi:hypothetical protein